MTSGTFPKAFRDKAFGKPDKPFVVVFVTALFVLCSMTFLLSLREPPAVNKKHIVKIQNRYARLVLDAFEIEKRKKKRKEVKPPEPQVKKPAQAPKPKKEVRREEKKIEVPKVVEVKVKKYEIRRKKIEIAENEKDVKIDTLPELPDVLDRKKSRYGSRKEKEMIGLDSDVDRSFNLGNKGPDINVSRSGRYGGDGGRSRKGLDLTEDKPALIQSNDPQIDTRTTKRYGSKRGGGGSSGNRTMIADEGEKKVLLARKPDPKVSVGKKYGSRSYKRSVPAAGGGNALALKEKDAHLKRSGKMVSLPEMTNIQNLEACVDPNEEKRLKKKIVAYAGDESVCSDKWGSYAYLSTEMFSTLEVRFVGSNKKNYNRCEALNLALQCLINKNKR